MTFLRVIELFAGIGAQASALERLGIPFKSIVCEIDPMAYKTYCAIHGDAPNLGDITKVEHLPPCDLLTYSFPCQDLSIAGNMKGMKEGSGTRSSLLWEVERLLNDMRERDCLPEVLLMENVEMILAGNNKPYLDKFIIRLNELGYESSYSVLNALDYGIPQHRPRCFMVSTLHYGHFQFPDKLPLNARLENVLEKDVSKKFYIKEKYTSTYTPNRDKSLPGQLLILEGNLNIKGRFESAQRIYSPKGVSPTICAAGSDKMPKIIVEKEGSD